MSSLEQLELLGRLQRHLPRVRKRAGLPRKFG
jgi:hypothetical protein